MAISSDHRFGNPYQLYIIPTAQKPAMDAIALRKSSRFVLVFCTWINVWVCASVNSWISNKWVCA